MTGLRAMPQWLVRRGQTAPPVPVGFSYTVHWTQIVRTWQVARRAALHAVRRLVESPGFDPTGRDRPYPIPEVDGQMHTSASLQALLKVLEAFDTPSVGQGEETPWERNVT
ncbi:MAG: hypothetical protein AB1449_10595 [Chloroflexota bacterium]